eukprot:1186091-Prorocentrum_minimum.AAC.2
MWAVVALSASRDAERAEVCKTARQTDLRVMLAGPKGREVGESGELDTGARICPVPILVEAFEGVLGLDDSKLPVDAQVRGEAHGLRQA